MTGDPIVEEVRKAREEYAKRFNYDLDAMIDDLERGNARADARRCRSRRRSERRQPVQRNEANPVLDQASAKRYEFCRAWSMLCAKRINSSASGFRLNGHHRLGGEKVTPSPNLHG